MYDMTIVTPNPVSPITAPEWGELASLLVKAGYGGEHVRLLKANMPRLISLLDELNGKVNLLTGSDWLDKLVEAEQAALHTFFGAPIDLAIFRDTLAGYGQDKLRAWAELGLEPHFLPSMTFERTSEVPGWKVRLNNFYWEQLENGNLLRPDAEGNLISVQAATLEGKVVLVDTRLKPGYKNGKQMFASDKPFLGKLIATLRKEGKIRAYEYGPDSSRFGVSADEWQTHIRPALADLLGLRADQLRLETALEANVIPQVFSQMPRAKDGETDTWLWYEECFESAGRRVHGGHSYCGGLASVRWSHAADRGHNLAFRPLGVLSA